MSPAPACLVSFESTPPLYVRACQIWWLQILWKWMHQFVYQFLHEYLEKTELTTVLKDFQNQEY